MAWSQEWQHNQDCLSKKADKVTATKGNKEEKRHLLCVSSMELDIVQCYHSIQGPLEYYEVTFLRAMFFLTIKETKRVEDECCQDHLKYMW